MARAPASRATGSTMIVTARRTRASICRTSRRTAARAAMRVMRSPSTASQASASCDLRSIATTGTTQRCSSGQCLCNGGSVESEDGVSCGDGIDNDCDGLTDCLEPSCAGLSCSADGGTACSCEGTTKVERSCDNLTDDDGDGLID